MIAFIDNRLNQITMYRLMLYYLIFLFGVALVLSYGGVLPYDPFALLFTVGFLLVTSTITNVIFARTFGVPANTESVYISALILALIITPITSYRDLWFWDGQRFGPWDLNISWRSGGNTCLTRSPLQLH
jgi:Na+-transporting NADH:ubiquinone oxidoreductase subunit NqrB